MDIDSSPKTPHLLRVFVKPSTFFPTYLFHETKTLPVEDEYHLYTWESTTLQELVQALVGIVPEKMRSYQGNWSFRLVSEEDARGARGTWKEKDLGVISLNALEGRESEGEAEESLLSLGILPPPSNPTPLYLLACIQNLPPAPLTFPHAHAHAHAPSQPFSSSSTTSDRVYSQSAGGIRSGSGPAPASSWGGSDSRGGAPSFGAPRGGGGSWSRGGGDVGVGAGGRFGGAFGGDRGTFGAAMRGAADNGYSSRGGRGGMVGGGGGGRGGYGGGAGGGRERERSPVRRRRRSPSY